ncbi:MAG: YlxR family protein [Desulfobulbus sp.]
MRRGHVPQRTCRGCGLKGPQTELVRFVAVEGRLVEDGRRRLPGKGVYCCDQENCRKRMAKKSKKVLKQD